MAETTLDASSIGQVSLDDVSLPPAVGEQLAMAYGADGTIENGAEWVTTMKASLAESVGRTPTAEDLCSSPDGRHTFEGKSGSQSYVCVLDPIIYPFLTDTPGTIRSETPVRGETVEIEVEPGGVSVSHDEAVISLGAADTIDPDDPVTFERIYQQVCGYVHVFADRAEYETWAGDADAATTAVSVDEGIGVSASLTTVLFD